MIYAMDSGMLGRPKTQVEVSTYLEVVVSLCVGSEATVRVFAVQLRTMPQPLLRMRPQTRQVMGMRLTACQCLFDTSHLTWL